MTVQFREIVQKHFTRQPRFVVSLVVQSVIVVQARQHIDQTKSILTPTAVGIVRGLHAVHHMVSH